MKAILVAMMLMFAAHAAIGQDYKGTNRPVNPSDKLNEEYCTGLFKTTDGTILDVLSNPTAKTYMNILDWLPGRVAGLQVFTSSSGVSIPLIRNSVPGIYVDEIPVSLSYLMSLNVNDVAIVKIIKTPFYGGFNSGGGAIAIYTIGGDEEEDTEN